MMSDDSSVTRLVSSGAQMSPLDALMFWVRERYGFRWQLRAEVLRFIRSYRGGPGEPRPFVGRAALLRQLDEWLLQPADRFRLLSGPAGRGKSALLLHWLGELTQRDRKLTIFYLPISIRFNTADEACGVELLFSALCDAFGELKAALPERPVLEDYQQGIAAAWGHMERRPQQSFLLAVDGLDEAVNQWLTRRRILPSELPSNLHVLVSARNKPGHLDGAAWLDDFKGQLPQSPADTGRYCGHPLLEVAPLDRAAMAEAVIQLGHPLDRLADSQAFVDALYHLTDEGDPLLLSLWLGQIWKRRDGQPELTAQALAELTPSFAGFYELWKRDQEAVWNAQGLPVHPDDVGEVLEILSVAHGPMLLPDLVDVLGCLPGRRRYWEPDELRAVLEVAHRLVVGEGMSSGYVLVHPRLAQHFNEQLAADPPRLRALQGAFRTWGARTVARLNSADLPARECPRYLLAHHVAHLAAMDVRTAEPLEELYLPLLHRGWATAWYEHEGSWHGYLNDLQHVLAALHAFNLDCARNDHPEQLRLGAQVRCALLAGSIRSMSVNFPPQLIGALARAGVWSLSRARRVVIHCRADCQLQCLLELAAVAAQKADGREGLQAALMIEDEWRRAGVLRAVAAQLQGDHELLQEALQAAAAIHNERERAAVLKEVTAQLHGDQELAQQALQAAVAIRDERGRAGVLCAAAAHLQGEARHTVLQQALEVARSIRVESARGAALKELALHLQGDGGLVQQALDAAQAIEDAWLRAEALRAVAVQAQGEARHTALQQALQAARAIRDPWRRADSLGAVAAGVQGEDRHAVLREVLETAAAIEDEEHRSGALRAVAAQLQGDERHTMLQHALAAARAIRDEERRAGALAAVAAHLQGEARHTVLQQALEAGRAIEDEARRAHALGAVAVQLHGCRELLQQALEAACALAQEERSAATLRAMAAHLNGDHDLLQQALELARAIRDEECRAGVLKELAVPLQGDRELLQSALQMAVALQDEEQRVAVLKELATPLQGAHDLLQQALEAARAIENDSLKAEAVSALAVQLQGDARHTVLQEGLQAAVAIRDEQRRVYALTAVGSQLQDEARHSVLQQALDGAVAIPDESRRVCALRAVTAQLQGDHDLLQQALQAARAIRDAGRRVDALSALAVQLQGDARHTVLQEGLQAAVAIRDEQRRVYALTAVGSQLQDEARHSVLQTALDGALAIPDKSRRVCALHAVTAQLQGDHDLLQQALQAARAIRDAGRRVDALSALAVQLQGDARHTVLQEGLQAAVAIRDEERRVYALTAVGSQLQDEARHSVLQQALDGALAIPNESRRVCALRAVTAQLQGDQDLLQQALEVARGIQDAQERAATLQDVAASLQGELRHTVLQEALEAARGLEDEHARAGALQRLGGELQADVSLQAACIEETSNLGAEDSIAITLMLARQNPSLLTYERWFDVLQRGRFTRKQLLDLAGELAWSVVQLTGRRQEAHELAVAIRDVCEWWP